MLFFLYFCTLLYMTINEQNLDKYILITIMQQSIEKIKETYPDEWLVLGNPVMSDDGQQILAATVLYHNSDKRKLARMDKPMLNQYKHIALRYNKISIKKRQCNLMIHEIKKT